MEPRVQFGQHIIKCDESILRFIVADSLQYEIIGKFFDNLPVFINLFAEFLIFFQEF